MLEGPKASQIVTFQFTGIQADPDSWRREIEGLLMGGTVDWLDIEDPELVHGMRSRVRIERELHRAERSQEADPNSGMEQLINALRARRDELGAP